MVSFFSEEVTDRIICDRILYLEGVLVALTALALVPASLEPPPKYWNALYGERA